MSFNDLRGFFRICLAAVAFTVLAVVQPASAQSTRPAAWSLLSPPRCSAYTPCSADTDPKAVCFAAINEEIRQYDCYKFTGLTIIGSGDFGSGTAWCRADANYALDGSCPWVTTIRKDALGERVFAYCEVLVSPTVAVQIPKRVGDLNYVCPVAAPPPPPPLPLGCAAGEGGFSQCPGDTGVPSSGPPGPPPVGTPTDGGPGPNLGAPGNDSSINITTVQTVGGSCKAVEAAGDPVFPATGNVYQEEIDYVGPVGLNLVRRYNSALPGWVHNYSVRVFASLTVAQVIRPDGRMHTFTGDVSGRWIAETTAREQLIQLSPANASQPLWQYITADDGSEWYDAQGRLVAVTRRGGQRYVVQQSDGLLRSVSDSFGHSLRFSYDAQRRLIQVTTPESTNVGYAYDVQGRLSQVTYADGSTRQYLYENPVYPLGLTAIVDERGVRFTSWTYDAGGRAATSERAGAQLHQFQYNADRSARIVDPLGTVRTQSYAWVGSRALFAGQTQPCADCFGDAAAKTLDAAGMLTQSVDYLGIATLFTNDAQRKLPISVTRAAGRPEAQTVQTQWHPTLHLPVLVTESGRTTSYSYDNVGNLLNKTILETATNQGRTWKWTYNAQNLNDSYTDPRGSVWTYGYDAAGNRVSSRNPLGQLTASSYDAAGRVTSQTEPNGLITVYAYDARGRLIKQARDTELTSYVYTPTGQIAAVLAPNGYQVSYTYDAAQRLTGAADNRGAAIAFTLDAAGNRLREEVRDASGAIASMTVRVINTLNRVAALQGAVGQTTTLGYDANGESIAETDPLDHTTRHGLDGLRRPLVTTFADNASATQAWNQLDQLAQVTDPKGVTTRYQTNAFGEVTAETSPDIGGMHYIRDAAGELAGMTDAVGNVMALGRDALGRPTRVQYSADNFHMFSYDQGQAGYLSKIEDGSGSTAYERNVQGRVLSKTQFVTDNPARPSQFKVQYGYTAGELTSVTYPSGLKVFYTRTAGRITGVSTQAPLTSVLGPRPVVPFVTNLAHTALGQPKAWSWSSGDSAARTFDADGRMIATEFSSYGYDAASRITALSQNLWTSPTGNNGGGKDGARAKQLYTTPVAWTVGYDSRNRLTSLARPGASTTYSYDPNSNRLTAVATVTSDIDLDGVFKQQDKSQTIAQSLNVDAASNRLLGVTLSVARSDGGKTKTVVTAPVSYSLDANGALTSDGLRTFEYDASRRLSKVKTNNDGDAAIVTYLHNALGQRVFKSEPQSVSNERVPNPSAGKSFVYDEDANLLGEYATGNETENRRQEYIWLPTEAGQAIPIGIYSNGRIFAVHSDHLGTPRLITDNANKPVWQWPYSAFGNNQPSGVLKAGDNAESAGIGRPVSLKATAPGIEANLRFPGQYFDKESNLSYNYFRNYQPGTGRYSQPDPIGLYGGLNRFGYVEGASVDSSDPTGLVKLHGNWCGPDFSGGFSKSYDKLDDAEKKAVLPPVSKLDSCCQTHDINYAACRKSNPCNAEARQQCFEMADRALSNCSAKAGSGYGANLLLFGNPQTRITDYMRNSKPSAEDNAANCVCSK